MKARILIFSCQWSDGKETLQWVIPSTDLSAGPTKEKD